MGVWKVQVSFRVRQDLRQELEEVAERERRTLGNVGRALLEWAALQLRVAGSVERLMKYQLGKKEGEPPARSDSSKGLRLGHPPPPAVAQHWVRAEGRAS